MTPLWDGVNLSIELENRLAWFWLALALAQNIANQKSAWKFGARKTNFPTGWREPKGKHKYSTTFNAKFLNQRNLESYIYTYKYHFHADWD